jgi:hypothetical protein
MLEQVLIRLAFAVARAGHHRARSATTTIPNPPPPSEPPPAGLPPDPEADPPSAEPPIKLTTERLPPQKPDPGYRERQRLLLARALCTGWAMIRTKAKGRAQ